MCVHRKISKTRKVLNSSVRNGPKSLRDAEGDRIAPVNGWQMAAALQKNVTREEDTNNWGPIGKATDKRLTGTLLAPDY